MKYLYAILTAVAAMSLWSCSDFLDVVPKGKTIPSNTIDYERILNSRTLSTSVSDKIIFVMDDLSKQFEANDQSSIALLYVWSEDVDRDVTIEPAIWGNYYKTQYSNNVIIKEVLDSEGGTETQKKTIYAEALVNRADLYFQLMCFYSPIYNPAKATTDLGIPLVTSIDVEDKIPPRSTVAQCMDAISQDIQTAIPLLPETNTNKSRVTKSIAYALLSRIYLSMYDYNNAHLYADKALKAAHQILDYNLYSEVGEIPKTIESPEQLWVRYSYNPNIGSGEIISQNLLDNFDAESDLRYALFIDEDMKYQPGGMPNMGISFAELYLTKAECLARTGRMEEALGVLNLFRKNRIATALYEDLTTDNPSEVVDLVLAERRRELLLKTTRWMDMRRLCYDGRMHDVVRIGEDGKIIATLPVNSPKYALQIPLSVLGFNPDMPKNPR